jgi:hypothetical protein
MRGGAPVAGIGGGNFARGNAGTFGGGMVPREGGFGREGGFDRDRGFTEHDRNFGRDHDRFDRDRMFNRDRRFGTFALGSDYDYYDYYDDGCYQWGQVPTRFGWRWQRVWVCSY